MKFIVLFTSLLLLFGSLTGQNQTKSEEIRYLFGKENGKITGFGGFNTQFGTANNKFVAYTGGVGAVLIDYKFYIGGFGAGIGEDLEFNDIYSEHGNLLYDKLRTTIGFGGAVIGYSFNHENPIHLAASIKIGAGSLMVYPKDFMDDRLSHIYSDAIGIIEPEIMVEFNLFRWWRIQTGVSYRYVFNIDDKKYYNSNGEHVLYFKNNAFNTPCIGINMIFRSFGPRESAK